MRMARLRRAGALAELTPGWRDITDAHGAGRDRVSVGEGAAVACAMVLATLGGCGKVDGSGSAEVAPSRKAGLWQQVLTRDGKPGRLGVLTLCVDAATDHELGVFGRHVGKGDCQHTVTRDPGGVYHFTSDCTLSNGARVRTMGTAAGDFASDYKVHSQVDVSGAPISPMNGTHVIDVTGRYQGACPAGMKPGDVNLGSGLKVNMDRLPQIASAVGGG